MSNEGHFETVDEAPKEFALRCQQLMDASHPFATIKDVVAFLEYTVDEGFKAPHAMRQYMAKLCWEVITKKMPAKFSVFLEDPAKLQNIWGSLRLAFEDLSVFDAAYWDDKNNKFYMHLSWHTLDYRVEGLKKATGSSRLDRNLHYINFTSARKSRGQVSYAFLA